MLTLKNRAEFQTLHNAAVLNSLDDSRPAIIYLATGCEPLVVTRADFRREVMRCAAALLRLGIAPRELVVIAHTQNLESIYTFWGALWIGAIPSMFTTLTEKLDPALYMRSMAELVSLSDVRAVVTTDAFAPDLRAEVACPVYGSADLRAANAEIVSPHLPDADEIAFLQHSSGTTGLQKGVALAHRAVLNQIANYSEAIALNDEDVIVSWLPLYHDMGLIAGFLLPLIQGIPLVLMSPFDWVSNPAMLLRAIYDYRGTLCWLPNFAYNHCARRIRPGDVEGLSLASMRMFINCSEPVFDQSHQLFYERFAPLGVTREMLAVSYAMAENVFAVTQTPPGQIPKLDVTEGTITKVSCGVPISGTRVRVVDAEGRELPERTVGQLAVQSDCMLTEYYKRPELNPFLDGWYLTGDTGYISDGELYVVGRLKDLIINAGKNVYPQDIEAIVNTVSGVIPGRAAAFGVYDAREGTELIAVVAEVSTADPDERQRINQQIRQAVVRASTVTVSYVSLVDERWLVKTSSGKIARSANREKWLAERAASDTTAK